MAFQTSSAMPLFVLLAKVLVIFVVLSSPVLSQRRYNHKLKVKFFTDVSMICDDIALNITELTNVQSLTWLFPGGKTVDATTSLDPEKFELSGPPGATSALDAYNLTALNIDYEMFGYYTCIVVLSTDSPAVYAIRWGLNVDGADFSDLIEGYKESAIIGGVAAGAVLLLVGVGCIIWECRYSNREGKEDEGSASNGKSSIEDDEEAKTNHAFSSDEVKGSGDVSETSLTVGQKAAYHL